MTQVLFTQQVYGPVLAVVWWTLDYKERLYPVSSFELAQETIYRYRQRFRIETFFSDQQGRGFHLHKSHIADPLWQAPLMIAACLVFIWIIYLGPVVKTHKTNRPTDKLKSKKLPAMVWVLLQKRSQSPD